MTALTQKETILLKDEKSHEELCIKKYAKYSSEADDPALKQLFSSILSHEQQHLKTIDGILNGQVPNMSQQSQQNQGQSSSSSAPASNSGYSQKDSDLCQDALSTEKYVSSTYNTSIFEFKDHNIRQALNHIQKEEQEHGEQIFNYMYQKGYYKPQ